MPSTTSSSGSDDQDEPVYETTWDFGLTEVVRGAFGGRRQTNRAILSYAEAFETVAEEYGTEAGGYVETYDPVTDVTRRRRDPDDLWDHLIDDVDVEELEVRYEEDGSEAVFRYEAMTDDPFSIEVDGQRWMEHVERDLRRGMGEKGKDGGLFGLF